MRSGNWDARYCLHRWLPSLICAGDRGRASPRRPVRPTAAATSRSTKSTIRGGRRFSSCTCAPEVSCEREAGTGCWSPMRIAIDARKLRDYGIGTYVRNLLRQLARQDTVNEYVVLCREADWDGVEELGPRFRPVVETARPYSIAQQF